MNVESLFTNEFLENDVVHLNQFYTSDHSIL